MPLAASLSSLLLASIATNAQSQNTAAAEDQIAEVIVTGTRVPKSVDKIPGAITVVGSSAANCPSPTS